MQNNKRVIVRTFSAGVHYGTQIERTGKEIVLRDARRIWSWYEALSLSEIASNGLNLEKSKISVPVDCITLTEAIEILTISEKSNLPV